MRNPMNNLTILKNYAVALNTVNDNSLTYYAVKDDGCNYVYRNQLWDKIHCVDEEAISLEHQELDVNSDLKCITTNTRINLLCGRFIGEEFKFFNYNKTPIVNKTNNQVVGISITGQELSTANLLNLTSVMNNGYSDGLATAGNSCWKEVDTGYAGLKLTVREEQVLFFVLQLKTAEEIAELLEQIIQVKVAANTVRNIIVKQLHPKFDTNSTKVLIERALSRGHQFVIPKSLSKPFLVELG